MLSKQKKPHRIAVLVMEHALPVEVSMPFLVFGAPALGYELMLCAETPGPVETDHGWSVTVQHGLDALATADTVIVTAFRGFLDTPSRDVLAKMKSAHDSGARIASICTGAFVLAAAGLLDGRRATTHWQFAADLARMYPAVHVDPTPSTSMKATSSLRQALSAGLTSASICSAMTVERPSPMRSPAR